MSELWLRKVRTHFHRLDFDQDGVISKGDFELMAERFCAAEKVDSVKQEKLKNLFGDLWLKYMGSPEADENGFLTEAVLIESLKKQRNDPKLKANLHDMCRCFFDALDTKEDGYLHFVEFRRGMENCGLSDSRIAEQSFKAIDTDHDGKLSFDEYAHSLLEFLFSEDEVSPYNLCWGPLI